MGRTSGDTLAIMGSKAVGKGSIKVSILGIKVSILSIKVSIFSIKASISSIKVSNFGSQNSQTPSSACARYPQSMLHVSRLSSSSSEYVVAAKLRPCPTPCFGWQSFDRR